MRNSLNRLGDWIVATDQRYRNVQTILALIIIVISASGFIVTMLTVF